MSWDGPPLPPDTGPKLSAALSGPNVKAALATLFADLTNKGIKPPDIAGDVQLIITGSPVAPPQLLAKQQNDFQPSWSSPARFVGLPLDERLRLRVHLVDKDAMFDDEVGSVDLNVQHLRAAAAKGGIYQVRVDDQHPQILFVGVNVMREQ